MSRVRIGGDVVGAVCKYTQDTCTTYYILEAQLTVSVCDLSRDVKFVFFLNSNFDC